MCITKTLQCVFYGAVVCIRNTCSHPETEENQAEAVNLYRLLLLDAIRCEFVGMMKTPERDHAEHELL